MSERRMPSVEDYPSAAIGEKKETRPATRPKSKVRHKKSIWKSVGDRFISEDVDEVGTSILDDILVPALRDLINDILHGAIDMTFGGGSYRGSYGRRGRSRSHISYDRMYDDRRYSSRRRRDDDYDDRDRRSRKRLPDCSEFIFDPRDFDRPSDAKCAAEDLLDDMADRIEEFGQVDMAWFLDQIGEDAEGLWNAEDWGWTNLSGVRVRGSNRNGWYIDLPKPKEL